MSDALIYTKKVKGAATHAIVIGVGYYNHLPGGKGKKYPNSGMGQLKSPPVSARAIARWLIENYHHPGKPLASVFLLLSDPANTKFTFSSNGKQTTVVAAPADMPNVRTAVETWRDLGHKRDLLLFFFCGHGLALGPELALLLSDFGAKPTAPLSGAIDFHGLWNGMDECAAREQCYFVDACRVGSGSPIRKSRYAGVPIIEETGAPNLTGEFRRAPIFFSTLSDAPAYAIPGKPSVYTDALLEALEGAGSGTQGGPWRVRTGLLNDALGVLAEDASLRLGIPERQITSANELTPIELNVVTTPHIPVTVTCMPDKFNSQATLTCENSTVKKTRKPAKDAWRLSLPLDDYDFAAAVKSKRSDPIKAFQVRPVIKRVELKVK